ncbi:MAG: hypothetical protein KKD63_09790 [Proteobacteria bacterium]|nr:hypothetical protein [Desulfobulbaceae bacterium]MBU4153161.1 hypothetical protein [Pseudomonadota bacterium]
MNIMLLLNKLVNGFLNVFGYEMRKKHAEFYLHEYSSYEEYRYVQEFHNKRKLYDVWADETTLDIVIEKVKNEFPGNKSLFAICHGTRNGFEQNYIADKLEVEIIGTDISETASQFSRSMQWDFHDSNDKWIDKCNFVYTNSLDQSWKPQVALSTWLDQLQKGGLLFIEHTEAHGPQGAGQMDPFGANPYYLPYLLCDWFKHRIAIEIIKSTKSNNANKVWLFVVKKN